MTSQNFSTPEGYENITQSEDHIAHIGQGFYKRNETGDLVWKFDNAMNIEIACNVPGHYQIGMVANVDLK